MGKRYTTDEFIFKARLKHSNKYDYSNVQYVGHDNNVKIICPIHGEFEQKPKVHLQGYGCSFCGKTSPMMKEEFIEKANKIHNCEYDYSLVEYKRFTTKIKIICKEHGEFLQAPIRHLAGSGCPSCGKAGKYTTEYIIQKFKSIYGDKYDYSLVEYIDMKTPVKIICKIHGVFEVSPSNHIAFSECKECSYIKNTHPNLIRYFVNECDLMNSYGSCKVVDLMCPKCKHLKKMSICTLYKQGFACPICSDGISTPEKFCRNLFNQLNIKFKPQYSPDWVGGKRYDLYIPSLEMIIEIHGSQHYIENKISRIGLTLEQENDQLKYNLAIKNGIKPENYIVVDCRKSEFEWLKQNCIKSFSNYFDLSNVDWKDIGNKSKKSMLIDVCEYWNNKNENQDIHSLQKHFSISQCTAYRYLNEGSAIGICIFNDETEMDTRRKKVYKIVYQYTMDGEFIREYKSVTEANKVNGFGRCGITHCCNGIQHSAYGYKWRYKDETI